MNPFPFFVGCDRSGTTLIQAVFDAHSELAIPYESHFISQLLRRRAHYEGSDGFDLEGFLADLSAYPFAERWGLSQEGIRAVLAGERPRSVTDAIRSVFALYARGRSKPRYGDKTPGYVRHIPLIANAFPEAKFVHIIRDGRDVALSLLEVEWAPDSIVDAARFWRQRVEAGREAGRLLGPRRYAELRYEDFLADPGGNTRRICDFLELTFEGSMLDYESNARAIIEQSDVPHRHQGLLRSPNKRDRDWRSRMKPHDVALFEAVSGPTLSSSGYERRVDTIPASVRVSAGARLLVRKLRGIPDRIRYELRPRLKRLPKLP